MVRYLAQRLLAACVVLFVVLLAAFTLLRLAPGDPARLLAGDLATEDQVQAVRTDLGLNRPLPAQFGIWAGRVLRGDLGRSVYSHEQLSSLLSQRLGPTLSLGLVAELLGVLVGVPLGAVAAWRRGSWIDRGVMVTASLGFAVPLFWLGYLLIFAFSLKLHWLPPTGYEPLSAGLIPFFKHIALPAVAISFGIVGLISRMTRATLLEVLRQDYIRTARAKGIGDLQLLARHAARNAALPVITVIGFGTTFVLSGVAVVETVFAIPGIGRLFVDSANNRDYPVLQGTVLLTGALFVLVNLVVDLSYAWLDPRIRL